METIKELIIDDTNLNKLNHLLKGHIIKTLIIKNIYNITVEIYNSNINNLVIRDASGLRIYLERCEIKNIINEGNPDLTLDTLYCNLQGISGVYKEVWAYLSELNYSNFITDRLLLESSQIENSKIIIEEEIKLNTISELYRNNIITLKDSYYKNNVIIYNSVGSRSDNLVIYKRLKLFQTGCFIGNIYIILL